MSVMAAKYMRIRLRIGMCFQLFAFVNLIAPLTADIKPYSANAAPAHASAIFTFLFTVVRQKKWRGSRSCPFFVVWSYHTTNTKDEPKYKFCRTAPIRSDNNIMQPFCFGTGYPGDQCQPLLQAAALLRAFHQYALLHVIWLHFITRDQRRLASGSLY